jgi:hypothetical protein
LVSLLRYALAAVALIAAPARADLWHDEAGELTPAVIGAAVATLETAAASIADDWRALAGAAGNSAVFALALLRQTGGPASLSEETLRILLTYDALRLGMVDPSGAFTEDADIFAWIEVVRPADAIPILPFRARLDTWLARYSERAE